MTIAIHEVFHNYPKGGRRHPKKRVVSAFLQPVFEQQFNSPPHPFSAKGATMRKALLFVMFLGLAAGILYADQSHRALKSSAQGVAPRMVKPELKSGEPSAKPEQEFEHPIRYEISEAFIRQRKEKDNTPPGGQTQFDANVGGGALAPSQGTNFNGLGQNGWIPYDAAIAVGPNHVINMTNAQFGIYTRTGTNLSTTQFATWWGTSAGTPFDPKCFYNSGHFVMLATSVGNGLANMYVSVSQTSDPTGAWWNYTFDWRLDGSTLTSNWGDYPGLGYDDNAIYINANQYTISNNSYKYSKVRVLSKAQLYSGASATYTDFINLLNSDGTSAFTVKPARCMSASASEYLLNTRSGGGSSVTLWRIDNAPAAPTLTRVATVSIGSYSVPPDAKQPGTGILIATNDCRTQDVAWRNGFVYTAFSVRTGSGNQRRSAIRYLKISNTGAVDKNITYTASGIAMYFPAVTADASNNMFMVFSRSSSSEYASMYRTGMLSTETSIQASALVKAGVATNTSGRWGDYNGIENDPNDAGDVWVYAGWANTSNRWATWNAGTSFGAPPKIARKDDETLSAKGFALFGNYPNPFNPSTTIYYTIPEEMHVRLSVRNALGQEVAVLLDETINAGDHQTAFLANHLPSGVYYYKLEAGSNVATGKLLLMK
jgi:hypothetical protein